MHLRKLTIFIRIVSGSEIGIQRTDTPTVVKID